MKALITRQNTDGSFDEVGMSNRTIAVVRSQAGAIRAAQHFAKNRGYRIELFHPHAIYGNPFKIITGFSS